MDEETITIGSSNPESNALEGKQDLPNKRTKIDNLSRIEGTKGSLTSTMSSDMASIVEGGPNDTTMTTTPMEDKHEHIIAKEFPPIPYTYCQKSLEVSSFDEYRTAHAESIRDIDAFWGKEATKRLDWFVPFPTVRTGGGGGSSSSTTNNADPFDDGDVSWFANGKLNVCYNAIDRHCQKGFGSELAMVWEGDEPSDVKQFTFVQMRQKICKIANALLAVGITKGDVVTIYMPMIPELPMTMLACARIGAVHSVVFAGFSSEALAQRVQAAACKVIITADIGKRGGKTIPLKDIVNDCRTKYNVEDLLTHVMVWERNYHTQSTSNDNEDHEESSSASKLPQFEMKPKDVRMDELVSSQRPYCVPVYMDSEDPLFILYTSGSTGKPKGLVHTTGGYALFASFTTQTTFGISSVSSSPGKINDLFACVADCGWITGHTYVVYGPLLNGCTTFGFESTPVYPSPSRYWDMIVRHKITHFYTAPTAIRLLMKYGDEIPSQYDVSSSVRVLGTVGEPINPEAWRWYYEVVGRNKCTIVDTYWQTETGGHVITNLPGITPMKPGSCTLPMYGIDPIVLDPVSGEPVTLSLDDEHGTNNRSGVLAIRQPWPGMARTCLQDHGRFVETYLKPYKGYYYTGDSVVQDSDGYFFIIGRVDDVLNVSGHRIGTAEVESALVAHAAVAQAAVVGQPHDVKGTSIAAFVMLKDGYEGTDELVLIRELKQLVRSDIGGFASPDVIVVAPSLPMTRSGKIMRRILRKIVCHEMDTLGDTSTLADPTIVPILIEKVWNKK